MYNYSKTKTAFALLFIAALFISCSDEILEIDEYQSQIVVDGWIEQGQTAKVSLTYSMSYFSELNKADLRDLIITRAKVSVSDGVQKEILTLKTDSLYLPSYIYKGELIRGEVGKTYTLLVEYKGEQVTGQTTIPAPVPLDSLWFQSANGDNNLGLIWIRFTDNAENKNYYKVITREYNQSSYFVSNYFSIFDDQYFSGETMEAPLYNHNTNIVKASEDMYFHKGDSVYLNFTTIDQASYKFWSSFTKEMLNGQNPFASTNATVESNISNGLGIWCGYGTSKYIVFNK